MTVEDISNRMDYALNEHVGGISLDEYNKSLYLTKAQETWASSVYKVMEYSEGVVQKATPLVESVTILGTDFTAISIPNSPFAFRTNISTYNIIGVLWEEANGIPTIPLDQNDKHYTLTNPFRKPSKSIAYRENTKGDIILHLNQSLSEYRFTYFKNPVPIVLEDITAAGLEINGISVQTTSELDNDSVLEVIDIAVNMVLQDMRKTLIPEPTQE